MSEYSKSRKRAGWKASTGEAFRAYAMKMLMDIGFPASMPTKFAVTHEGKPA